MSFFEAILLGLIQGITEFFPISSSGHLILTEQLLGVETDYGILFKVVLHIGTLMAILFAFRKEVIRLFYSYLGIFHDICKNVKIFLDNIPKRQEKKYRKILRTQYRKLAVLVLVANIPTAMIGYIMRNLVAGLTKPLLLTGIGLLVTGLLLFVSGLSEKGDKKPKNTSWSSALIVGACQGFSVIPGISRFGTTITAGLLNGYNKAFALKYSFLISIPAILGAAILELFQMPSENSLTFGFVVCCIFGAITAAIAGFFAIQVLFWVIRKGKMKFFSYYCFIVGILVIFVNYLV